MNILIIAENIDSSAPGKVYQRLIDGLSKDNCIDVLVSKYSPESKIHYLNKIFVSRKKYIHPRIKKFIIGLTGDYILDKWWSYKQIKTIKAYNYDLVFSFVSFHHYSPLIAGKLLSDLLNVKFAVYLVDAIPAPIGWPENELYRRGVFKLMKKYLSKCDALFSSNEKMLKYQLNTFVTKKNLISNTLYTPSIDNFKNYDTPKVSTFNFVYTGGVYGARKIDSLLRAFNSLLDYYPNSNLVFVGTKNIEALVKEFISIDKIEKVKIEPFSNNLDVYYSDATALLDIDADLENDVFLSSKITNYLMVNRIIISITGNNSPSKLLFKNIDSIMQCNHDEEQILLAMKNSILNNKLINFNDRNEIIELFKLESVIQKLKNNLNDIVN